MLFSKINLRSELIKERSRQQRLMNEVHALLYASAEKDALTLQRLRSPGPDHAHEFRLEKAEAGDLFSIDEIRRICIRYRLRFLDAHHYRSEYPYEAIARIHAFEEKYNTRIQRFKIAAPDHAFHLENINKDPLLFAQLDDNTYYLVHKWGTDLAWYKRLTLWPLQTFKTYFISLWLIAALFVFLLPSSIMHVLHFENEMYLRIWLTIHTFIGLFGMSLWAGLSYDKTFSSQKWESKYYNY